MQRHIASGLLTSLLLAGCGGGSDAPLDRVNPYLGEWSHCTVSPPSPIEILTTWTIRRTAVDQAEVVVRQTSLSLSTGTPCNGTPLEAPRVARTAQLAVTGEQVFDGRTWNRVEFTLDGRTQREFLRVSGNTVETSVRPLLDPGREPPLRDAEGYPVQPEGVTLTRR